MCPIRQGTACTVTNATQTTTHLSPVALSQPHGPPAPFCRQNLWFDHRAPIKSPYWPTALTWDWTAHLDRPRPCPVLCTATDDGVAATHKNSSDDNGTAKHINALLSADRDSRLELNHWIARRESLLWGQCPRVQPWLGNDSGRYTTVITVFPPWLGSHTVERH